MSILDITVTFLLVSCCIYYFFLIKDFFRPSEKKIISKKENKIIDDSNFKTTNHRSSNKNKQENSEKENKLVEQSAKINNSSNAYVVDKLKKTKTLHNESLNESFINSSDFYNILIKQKKLYDLNILSFTEFTAFKKDYINSIQGDKLTESKEDFLLGISSLVNDGILSSEELSEIKTIISKNLI